MPELVWNPGKGSLVVPVVHGLNDRACALAPHLLHHLQRLFKDLHSKIVDPAVFRVRPGFINGNEHDFRPCFSNLSLSGLSDNLSQVGQVPRFIPVVAFPVIMSVSLAALGAVDQGAHVP